MDETKDWIANSVPDARVMGDLDALVAHAKRHPSARADRIGVTGFCLGGMYTLLFAAHNRDVKEMEAALRAAGKTAELIVYPGAPHAFHADYRPSYRPEAAKDAWARCVAWFNTHLKG